jgi:hypothetical protein
MQASPIGRDVKDGTEKKRAMAEGQAIKAVRARERLKTSAVRDQGMYRVEG